MTRTVLICDLCGKEQPLNASTAPTPDLDYHQRGSRDLCPDCFHKMLVLRSWGLID